MSVLSSSQHRLPQALSTKYHGLKHAQWRRWHKIAMKTAIDEGNIAIVRRLLKRYSSDAKSMCEHII